MNLDECLTRACEQIPGLSQGALALLPEGILVAGVGAGSSFEREPLVRSAARCFAHGPDHGAAGPAFVEHVLVSGQEVVVVAQGRRYRRLALALSCRSETNLAFVLSASRAALREVEATIDVRGLGI